MFELNSKTYVNKEFKIREIFKMIKADKATRDNAACIEKIILINVISEQTLNIKSDDNCKEIYIFNIILNEKTIPLEFIKELDKFIELHTYFIFLYEDEIKELCIYKSIGNGKIKRGNIYESDWQSEEFIELPYCLNINEIYDNLILNIVPLKARINEDIRSFLERFDTIEKLKKEINTLEKKAFKESQPRKKFDLGRQIRIEKEKLQELEGEN